MDREKIIEALQYMISENCTETQFDYTDDIEAAIAMLKEQEAVKPVLDEKTGRIWLCGNCGSYVGFEDNDPHDPNEFDKYCRKCGRPVLWEGR